MKKFKCYLIREEKSKATLEKYMREVKAFYCWSKGYKLNKEKVLEYNIFQYIIDCILVNDVTPKI